MGKSRHSFARVALLLDCAPHSIFALSTQHAALLFRTAPLPLRTEQGTDFCASLDENFCGNPSLARGFASAPIQAFYLVRQDCARALSIYDNFERVALELGGQRTTDHHACLAVVGSGAEYQGGPVTRLFMSCPG